MEKGFEQGMLQGVQQGVREGEYAVLLRKFSRIPAVYLDKLNNATAPYLLALSERLLEAQTVEEIFADPEDQ